MFGIRDILIQIPHMQTFASRNTSRRSGISSANNIMDIGHEYAGSRYSGKPESELRLGDHIVTPNDSQRCESKVSNIPEVITRIPARSSFFFIHPNSGRRVVVPVHPGREIPKGTLIEILKQAGITRENIEIYFS